MVERVSRRAQTASGAAIFVAIIGGLLVAYILFMSPVERERILFGDGSGSGGSNSGYGSGGSGGGVFTQYGPVLIFKDTPGTLRLQKSTLSEHNIPSTTIFTAINTIELKRIESATIKNGVFVKRDLTIEFEGDRNSGRNFLLSFNVDQAGTGPIRVMLNNHLIYERPIQERSPSPIQFANDYLQDGKNTLVISVGDNGLSFWNSNTYALHNILITADVIDTSGAVAAQTFTVPDSELGAFESAQLQFVPECDPKKAGRLVVNLNTQLIRTADNKTTEVPNVLYSGFPDCGVLFKTDVSKEQLRQGENHVLFASQGGQYVIDRVKLMVRLQEQEYPTYYFNIPKDMYDTLAVGQGQLRVTMTFTDYRNDKVGEVVVNGFVQSFATKEYAWQAVIDPGVLTPGPNTIMVAPHADRLDIAELKIELV
jgi:hypothetical protein